MADIQELLARLTSNDNSAASRPQNPATTTSYAEPSVSSPLMSPPLQGLQPKHESAVMSPNIATPANSTPAGDNRSNNLLNLLKFSQPSAASPEPTSALSLGTQSPQPVSQLYRSQTSAGAGKPPGSAEATRPISAQDLVSSFMRQPSTSSIHSPPIASPASMKPAPTAASTAGPAASAGGSPQAYLLNLLNQAKPAPTSRTSSMRSVRMEQPVPSVEKAMPEAVIDNLAQELANASVEQMSPLPRVERKSSPIRVFGSEEPSQANVFEAPQAANKPREGIFNYVNPFEQLHASSPRNRITPSKPHSASRSRSPKVEILEAGHDTMAHEAAVSTREIMSDTANNNGNKGDKGVEQVVAETMADLTTEQDVEEMHQAVKQGASEIKQDLKDEKTRREIEEVIGKPMTDALKEVAEDLAADTGGDSWESADAEEGAASEEVRVYNFPMKPFVSIDIRTLPDVSRFREGTYNNMARLKKEFDQNDRNLVDANERYFTYVSPKHGGFRVVRQTDGANKHVFSESRERLVNIALSSATKPLGEMDAVLATGVDGTVFWTLLSTDKGDQFSDDLMERSFTFPPFPVQDDNTSGGQLKTRARKSSKNPNYFAIGRGKAIHIIWPNVANTSKYTNMKTHVCDSEKYLKQRSLKISTGKAGKDFTFSQCDSVIVSLDKTGKMRFWDIRPLIAPPNSEPGELTAIEIKTPILTLATTSPANKSWPTSVMFLDKERPHNKGIALRYLIVGMKQNHTLQLWDLCLGKAVQEINLPHENESDGICSVAYHPQSGVISVGHPTRNAIYFIHLSAPRYMLPAMSQAKFLERTVAKDPTLPKIESTAIMTGIREYSFSQYGELRSFEILPDPASVSGDADSNALFDLYVMHSKGVCTLTLKREDLGWSADNTVLHPVNAVESGAVEVSELKPIDAPEPSEPSINGDLPSKKAKSVKEASVASSKRETPNSKAPIAKKDDPIARTLDRVEAKQDAVRAAIINGTENVAPKSGKKKKSTGDATSQVSSAAPEQSKEPVSVFKPAAPVASYAKAVSTPVAEIAPSPLPPAARELDIRAPASLSPAAGEPKTKHTIDEVSLKRLEDNVTATLSRLFNEELISLYRKFDEDKRVQDAAGAAKQDAVLRLVSSTLTENVEKSLTRIVSSSLESALLPSLSGTVAGIVERKLNDISQELTASVSNDHKNVVNNAMLGATRDQGFQQSISQKMATQIATHIESHLSHAINKSITPAFTNMTVNTVQQMAGDLEQRMTLMLQQADVQRHNDSLKIDQLTTMIRGLSESLQTMASSQSQLVNQVASLQQQLGARPSSGGGHMATLSAASEKQAVRSPVKSEEEIEADEMRAFLNNGSFEGAIGKWVQSSHQVYLFSEVLTRCSPQYVSTLSPLVALSATAALTQPLEPNMGERLIWLEAILEAMDPHDREIGELVPRIMEIVSQRLQSCYMQLGEKEDRSPLMKRIVAINNRALALMKAALSG